MNLPNKLTLARIVLIPFFLLALHVQLFTNDAVVSSVSYWIALLLFVVAAITDYLDGAIARRLNIVTNFGKLLDPLADKLLTMAAFVSFVEILGPNHRPIFPAWAIVLILGREYLVTGLRSVALNNGKVIHADKWGKQKTIWQIIGIITVVLALAITETLRALSIPAPLFNRVLPYVFHGILAIIVVLTTVSGAIFFVKNRAIILDKPDQ